MPVMFDSSEKKLSAQDARRGAAKFDCADE